jgi:O-antigen ligase
MSADFLRKAVGPAYLFLCLTVGGSAQGVWGNAVLQILAVLILAWYFISPSRAKLPRDGRTLGVLLAAGLAVVLLQLIPLPPAIWTHFPGREIVVGGAATLGLEPGWSSLSLAPYDGIATLFVLLPSAAMFAAVLLGEAKNGRLLAGALIAATFAGVLLGLLQVSSGDPLNSPWYLYRISNFGFATGFFANSNHMASLLLVAIAFTAALGADIASSVKDARKRYSLVGLTAGGIGMMIIGLALNGSLAGAGMLLPVALATLIMSVRLNDGLRKAALVVAAASLAGFLLLIFSPLADKLAFLGASTSISTRQEIFRTSIEAAKAFNPVGSGLGTFANVYPLFENADAVGRTWVNHAHNDYLELIVELGIPGLLLILLFLLWWMRSSARMFAAANASPYAKAGAIGSAAILVHSLVDFPLRTSAMSAVFALCLAMILLSRQSARRAKDLREARHLVIE